MCAAPEKDRVQRFQRLLAEYQRPLRRLTASYAFEPADRDDLFQEILMAVWTALPRFQGTSSERTWIYRIAHNIAISASVRQKRRTSRQTSFAPDFEAAGHSPDPESHSLELERRRLLIDAVGRMGALDKQIVMLYLEGLSNREIADVVGLAEGAIATRLSRARTALAARIKEGR